MTVRGLLPAICTQKTFSPYRCSKEMFILLQISQHVLTEILHQLVDSQAIIASDLFAHLLLKITGDHWRSCKIFQRLLKEKLFFCYFLNSVLPECTFIILDKQRWADASAEEEQCMVGDVNIFLTDPTDPSLAELEIMIAGDVYLKDKKAKAYQTSTVNLVFTR